MPLRRGRRISRGEFFMTLLLSCIQGSLIKSGHIGQDLIGVPWTDRGSYFCHFLRLQDTTARPPQ